MKSVVGLYDRFEDAQQAVRALRDAGFRSEDLSLLSRDAKGEYSRFFKEGGQKEDVAEGAATGAGIGAVLGGLGGLLVGLGALAIPGIGPVLAAGPLVSALAGAGIGAAAGGIVGALVDLGIPEEHAEYYAEGVRRGGTLVVLQAEDYRADEAVMIMNRFNPVDLKERSDNWRQNNWTGYNASADPLTDDQMEFGRMHTDTRGMTGRKDFAETDFDRTRMEMETDEEIPVTGDFDRDVTMPMVDEDIEIGKRDMPLTGADWNQYDTGFRQHYQMTYGMSGRDYDFYQPAYRFGYELYRNPRYANYDWYQLEPEARRDWESRGLGGAWEDVKDAVRHAWNTMM